MKHSRSRVQAQNSCYSTVQQCVSTANLQNNNILHHTVNSFTVCAPLIKSSDVSFGSDWDFQYTECTAARDYGFPVRLENPVGALLRLVWLCGMVGWCGCSAHVAGLLFRLGGLPGGFLWGLKSFGEPHSVGMSNCLVGAM